MTDDKTVKMDADIRTQGLVGIFVLLMTLGAFTYHAWKAKDVNAHQNVSDAVMSALGQANMDIQSLFDNQEWDHNLALLRRRTTFGSDFVTAWLVFFFFLQRAITMSGPSDRRGVLLALVIALLTLGAGVLLNNDLSEADRQGTISAPILNRVMFYGHVKWVCLCLDAMLCGMHLIPRPLIVRVGGIILGCCGLIGFFGFAGPSGVVVSYSVLGILIAMSGVSLLILWNPRLLYTPAATVPSGTESMTDSTD